MYKLTWLPDYENEFGKWDPSKVPGFDGPNQTGISYQFRFFTREALVRQYGEEKVRQAFEA